MEMAELDLHFAPNEQCAVNGLHLNVKESHPPSATEKGLSHRAQKARQKSVYFTTSEEVTFAGKGDQNQS